MQSRQPFADYGELTLFLCITDDRIGDGPA